MKYLLIQEELTKTVSKKHISLRVKDPFFLSNCKETFFFDRFSKNIQLSEFTKLSAAGVDLFHATSRQTNKYEEANICFLQFCENA
jgi:hypothetical protein